MNKKTEKKQEAKSSKKETQAEANLQLPARSRIKSNALDS